MRVDPTLEPTYAHIWSETDDTYVADTGSATDRSTQYVLKAGFDGTSVYRSFLHFDLTSLEGMNVIGADLALVQNGSGSCTATPLDVYEVTEEWAGDETTAWPGPDTAADPTTTITSGKGHDSTCPYGFAQADLTRTARNWIADSATNFGLSLRARDEASTAQFKQAGSRESYVPPTINVLWSDPTLESAPFDPVSLAPRNVTTTAAPEFSALYQDPEFDDGVVVFFGYVAATGAFSGAMVSDEVAAGADAVVTASSFPLDFAFEWRAMSVDLVNEVPSPLSEPVPLVRPSVRLVSPLADDTVSGIVTVNAQLDDSIGDATGVVFSLDATPVMADTAAPYRMVGPSNPLDDGDHVLTATISGGAADGRTSAPVTITIDNEPDTDPATEAAPNETRRPVLRRMRGATDEPANIDPINSHEADCGFSEDLPGNRTLWVFCDRLNSNGNGGIVAGSVAALVHSGSPPSEIGTAPFLPVPDLTCTVIANDGPGRFLTGLTSYPGDEPNETVVVVFYRQGCRRQMYAPHNTAAWDPGTAGVAVATYNAVTHVLSPAVVGNPDIWKGRFGSGAFHVLHGNGATYLPTSATGGYIYVYACREPDRNRPDLWGAGRCRAARIQVDVDTSLAQLGDRTRWRFGVATPTGTGWQQCAGTCAGSQLQDIERAQVALRLPTPDEPSADDRLPGSPPCPDGTTPLRCPDPHYVPQHFQVAHSPQLGAFVSAHPREVAGYDPDRPDRAGGGERFVKLRIRAATDPAGRWSLPIDVPIDCDGRFRSITGRDPDFGAHNCYQMQAHPHLSAVDATSLVFGYYDRFQGSNTAPPANRDPEPESIRFVRVPLCMQRNSVTTQESAATNHVVAKCFMTPGNWTGTMTRRDVAAILWRLSGFVPHTVDGSLAGVPGDYREAVSFLVDPDLPYKVVWPHSDTDPFDQVVTRGELIRLLWLFRDSPPSTETPGASDWGDIEETDIAGAVQWAYETGITCAGTFYPGNLAKRRTAATWIYRLQQAAPCGSTESE